MWKHTATMYPFGHPYLDISSAPICMRISILPIANIVPLISTVAGLLRNCTLLLRSSTMSFLSKLGCGNNGYSSIMSSGCGITRIRVSGHCLLSCIKRLVTFCSKVSSGETSMVPDATLGCDSDTKGPSYYDRDIECFTLRPERVQLQTLPG